ncbi:hypothetical protein [Rhizorhabdus argentea]|uniref:hypothetical protein n=1 Tax=Rhizorhabdus argentea TaxID=1387174 RepID=UPI0030ECEE56
MRHQPHPLRPGLTAIAAALALSSTPSFAQSSEASAAAAPVLVAPPPVVAPAPAVTTQSATSAPTAPPATAPSTTATAAPTPAPLVFDEEPAPAPVAHSRKATAKPAPAAAVKAAPLRMEAAPASTPAPAPVVASSSAAEPAVPAPAVANPIPVEMQRSVTHTDGSDDVLPIAGAGVAILALAGGALALGRRRRDADADELALAPFREIAPREPGHIAPVAASAVPVMASDDRAESFIDDAPVTAVPAGFDLSRFGRHTRAAYQGPTANNPSHSLKRRLKRASFFDQREREGLATPVPAQSASPAPVREMARAAQGTDHLTVRAPARPRPAFRPAYQS